GRRHDLDGRDLHHAGIDRRGKTSLRDCRRSRGPRTGAHVRLAASQRPDLELLGEQLSARNDPPAYDILYWNNDTTRLPARLHADFLGLMESNPYVNPGRITIGGHPLDMGKVDIDSYVVAGTTDHITPWQGCYETARLYGKRSTFVLSNSGHIQSLINPPDNRKAFFWAGAAQADNADAWLAEATKTQGSWWPHWRGGVNPRSRGTRPPPGAVGSAHLPPPGGRPG